MSLFKIQKSNESSLDQDFFEHGVKYGRFLLAVFRGNQPNWKQSGLLRDCGSASLHITCHVVLEGRVRLRSLPFACEGSTCSHLQIQTKYLQFCHLKNKTRNNAFNLKIYKRRCSTWVAFRDTCRNCRCCVTACLSLLSWWLRRCLLVGSITSNLTVFAAVSGALKLILLKIFECLF